jgi:ferredoxin/flavodoxin
MKVQNFKICVLCYSGAGNTLLVASCIKEQLLKDGYFVDFVFLKKDTRVPDLQKYDFIVLASPVYAYHPPKTVVEFVNALPKGEKPFYLLFTKGLILGNAAREIFLTLKEKGYRVAGFSDIVLADTLFLLTSNRDSLLERLYLAPNRTFVYKMKIIYRSIIKALHSHRKVYLRKKVYAFLTEFIARRFYRMSNQWAKELFANEKCNLCGACVKVCPRKNITIVEGKIVFGNDCEFCTACIHRCPKEAINVGGKTRGKARFRIGKEAKYFRKIL